MNTFGRKDIRKETTARIIAALRQGVAPWVRPWSTETAEGAYGRDRNISGNIYSGINVLITALAHFEFGYISRQWLTYNQARKLGGYVRKGERSTTIIAYKPTPIRNVDPDTGEVTRKVIPFLKGIPVFNTEQCDGLPAEDIPDPPTPMERHTAADAFVSATGAHIYHGGSVACYVPSLDSIRLPFPEAFVDSAAYYSTTFHELTHWTGHSARLGRLGKGNNEFGSAAYAAEELVAELGSAFLCSEFGVDGRLQHAEYVGNWLQVLQKDNRAIFRAAALAHRAVDYMHGAETSAADTEADAA